MKKVFLISIIAFLLLYAMIFVFKNARAQTGCTLTSAVWSAQNATEGMQVNLNATGTGTCDGQTVSFEVRENDSVTEGIGDDPVNTNPASVTFSGNNATGVWTAEWQNDCNGLCNPPEYFFNATVGSSTIRSSDPMLTTIQYTPTSPNDWPQVQKDPQHTGYSSETLGTNFRVAWTYPFQPDRVHPQVQAIIYQGKAFVGTEGANGQKPTLYALDAVNPEPNTNPPKGRVIWRFEVGGPILNSAAADNGKIYVASMDGAVYAIYTDTENGHNAGELVWRQQLSQRYGFSTAPVVADGKVMLGGRDGIFYALDPNDGQIIWQYNVGPMILQTAAYSNGRVFFGAMDMSVYAINTADGTLSWKTPKIVEGATFKDYWPVVYQGKVFIRPMANTYNGGVYPGGPFSWGDNWNWLSTWGPTIATGGASLVPDVMNAQDTVMSDYQANPQNYNKNLFILDENTGQETTIVPHWTTQTMNGATTPPCVDKDNLLVVPLTFIRSGWGRLDLNQQRIVDILYDGYDTRGQPFGSNSGTYPAGMGNPDENYTLSCTQNYILAKHVNEAVAGAGYTGAFNLETRRWTSIGTEGQILEEMKTNTQGGGTNPYSISNGMIYGVVHHTLTVRTTN